MLIRPLPQSAPCALGVAFRARAAAQVNRADLLCPSPPAGLPPLERPPIGLEIDLDAEIDAGGGCALPSAEEEEKEEDQDLLHFCFRTL
ncbi:hypothetical protein FQA47_022374 [Oryzias melastigma]|uniref:Uncharacterized protein n=1 Tax=Oryzias melastigma TaxID=30732 RepID=A0A834FRM8_ORYME|nr:hypothetical protein FQA47_022374 [Oryzias melastigma]